MSLKKVEYYSVAADGLTADAIIKMGSDASTNNSRLGVTGWLTFDGTCFFQYIEGEAAVIDQLYAVILADPRHHDIVTLASAAIDQRLFDGWSMHFAAGHMADSDAQSTEALVRPIEDTIEEMATRLSLRDVVALGGEPAGSPSAALGQAIESAGRRWQILAYRTFVKRMLGRRFGSITEVAAAIVELVILATNRGPAVLPNLRAFLIRRTDLTYQEISRACRDLHGAAHDRRDALMALGVLELTAAVIAVTFAVRALADVNRGELKTVRVRRLLVNLCRAALGDESLNPPPAANPKASRPWASPLIH